MTALGGILLGLGGLGVGYLLTKTMSPDMPDYSSMMADMNRQFNAESTDLTNSMPDVPVNPATGVDPNDPNAVATSNQEAEDAQRLLAERAAQAAKTYNPNQGLGITSNAPGKSRGLGGI